MNFHVFCINRVTKNRILLIASLIDHVIDFLFCFTASQPCVYTTVVFGAFHCRVKTVILCAFNSNQKHSFCGVFSQNFESLQHSRILVFHLFLAGPIDYKENTRLLQKLVFDFVFHEDEELIFFCTSE